MGHYDSFYEQAAERERERRFREDIKARKVLSFKLLRPDAILPEPGSEFAAGFDLRYSPSKGEQAMLMVPGFIAMIPIGVAVALPKGHHGQVWARSGNATKRGLTTEAGIIDEDYRGEIFAICANRSQEPILIEPGMAVAQLVIVQNFQKSWNTVHVCADKEELVECGTRGASGFGSTGR